jgi:hypothetical protein
MTEQELTALAKNLYEAPQNQGRPHYQRDLAEGYLALLAERDALTMASDVSVTNARLALNDWHQCSTPEELARWRAAQARLIIAAKASVKPEVDALMAERDTLKAQLEDVRVWMRDAERVAAGRICSCWLGTSSTCGSSEARRACAVHGDDANPPNREIREGDLP